MKSVRTGRGQRAVQLLRSLTQACFGGTLHFSIQKYPYTLLYRGEGLALTQYPSTCWVGMLQWQPTRSRSLTLVDDGSTYVGISWTRPMKDGRSGPSKDAEFRFFIQSNNLLPMASSYVRENLTRF